MEGKFRHISDGLFMLGVMIFMLLGYIAVETETYILMLSILLPFAAMPGMRVRFTADEKNVLFKSLLFKYDIPYSEIEDISCDTSKEYHRGNADTYSIHLKIKTAKKTYAFKDKLKTNKKEYTENKPAFKKKVYEHTYYKLCKYIQKAKTPE